jgi:hypothetical protein
MFVSVVQITSTKIKQLSTDKPDTVEVNWAMLIDESTEDSIGLIVYVSLDGMNPSVAMVQLEKTHSKYMHIINNEKNHWY